MLIPGKHIRLKILFAILFVIATGLGMYILCSKQETRNANFILIGERVRRTKIISSEKLPPETYVLFGFGTNGYATYARKQTEYLVPKKKRAINKAEYSFTCRSNDVYACAYEKYSDGKRKIYLDYASSPKDHFPRTIEENEVGAIELIVEHELWTVEQDIYNRFSCGKDRKFTTISYTVCPITCLRIEHNIYPLAKQ